MSLIYSCIKEVDPNLCLLSNPAFPRHGDWTAKLGINPNSFGKYHDLMFGENADSPQYHDGNIIHQIKATKFARESGYKVPSSSWLKDKNGLSRLPENHQEVELSIMEPAINDEPYHHFL